METRNLNQCWSWAGSKARPQNKTTFTCLWLFVWVCVCVCVLVLVFVLVLGHGCVRVFTNVQMSLRQTIECEQNFCQMTTKAGFFPSILWLQWG